MQTAEIKKMNTVERLRAMEALWDALIHEDGEPPSPEWHGDILAERKRRMEKGEMEGLDYAEWIGEHGTLKRLKEKADALKGIRFAD